MEAFGRKVRLLNSQSLGWYLLAFVVATLISATWVRFAWDSEPWILPGGVDSLWVQGTFESIRNNGFLAHDPHLNWPHGLSIWSHPQFGILLPGLAWGLTRVFNLGSGFAAIWALLLTAGLNSASTLFFFRSLVGRTCPILAVSASVALGISPFTLAKIEHLNVACWFFVPLLLGACIRFRDASRGLRWSLLTTIASASVLSPLWWLIVAVALLIIVCFSWALAGKWAEFVGVVSLTVMTMVGIAVQLGMYASASVDGQAPTRSPWDSNVYGGHLIDVFLSSPFVSSLIPSLEDLAPGASVELSRVGLFGGISVMAAGIVLLMSVASSSERTPQLAWIRVLSLASLLLFLAGGVGNVQAGVVILFGGESPARVWSRVIIVLAVMGAAFLLYRYAEYTGRMNDGSIRTRRMLALTAPGIIILTISIADLTALEPPIPSPEVGRLEVEAVDFLRSQTSPCPVAQLPLDSVPLPRLTDTTGTGLTLPISLRPYVPFILAPEYFWSIGPFRPDATDGLNGLPVVFTTLSLRTLKQLGYCAVFYDHLTGATARRLGVDLQGRDLSGVRPHYTNERYSVILLADD